LIWTTRVIPTHRLLQPSQHCCLGSQSSSPISNQASSVRNVLLEKRFWLSTLNCPTFQVPSLDWCVDILTKPLALLGSVYFSPNSTWETVTLFVQHKLVGLLLESITCFIFC